ncbi:MAG: tyrosine-protein phosphatase [Clostridiales bacterium]|nr:tyrosine-protein phosphatase [Clostridiales bacterium]
MNNKRKCLAMALAIGMAFSTVACAGAQANADNSSGEPYVPTITSPQQGKTISLLEGDIYEFASNYSKYCGMNFTLGDYQGDRYMPRPATLTWKNQREGALYYTFKIGTDKELEDADTYLVSETIIHIDYLYAATDYYYQIYAHYDNDEVLKSRVFDFTTAALPRTVYIEGVSNTRDMGGYLTVDGTHRIKQGMIYRRGEVDRNWGKITEEGKRVMVHELGIKTDLDLREASGAPLTQSPIDPSLNYVNAPKAPYYTDKIISAEYKESLIKEIRTFANPDNYPIYLHCSLGRDRAGTLAFLISALLGMNEMDIFRDYEMSFFSKNGWADAAQGAGQLNAMVGVFQGLYDYIKNYKRGGSMADNAAAFMMEHLGITQEEIDTIREIMLEEV